MSADNLVDSSGRKRIDDLPFSFNARTLTQLGRESISSHITAIAELVKNAYDADATKVTIIFSPDQKSMVITDDGVGMSLDAIKTSWFLIGTSMKKKKRKTKDGRIFVGEKGLGRLGLDRLCTTTTLTTVAEGASEGVEIEVDWTKYEDEDTRVDQIKHGLYSVRNAWKDEKSQNYVTVDRGTRLALNGLKDLWSPDFIHSLREELSLLVSPFEKDTGFEICLYSGLNNPQLDGKISPHEQILEAALWQVTAEIDDDHKVSIHMRSEIHDTEYKMKPVLWEDFIGQKVKPHCGPLSVMLYFFPRKDVAVGDQLFKIKEIRQFMDSNQGVRIYRDKFRVRPYGSPDGSGDWLTLAYRRAQSPSGVAQDNEPGAWRVGYNQLVGAVFLSLESNPNLIDQSSRESLIDGQGFRDMKLFTSKVVRYLEVNHQRFEIGKKQPSSVADDAAQKVRETVSRSGQALESIDNLIEHIDEKRGTSDLQDYESIRSELEKTKAIISSTKEQAEESESASQLAIAKFERQKNMLSNLASLGIMAASFGHETGNWTGNIVKFAEDIQYRMRKDAFWDAFYDEYEPVFNDLIADSEKVRRYAEFALSNIESRKRKKEKVDLCSISEALIKLFEEVVFTDQSIEVELQRPDGPLLIKAYPMDWESILVNLFTNASWALEETPLEERKISISLSEDEDDVIMLFEDNGRGVEAGMESMIFEATFTTKRDAAGNETGTGLGLTIVKALIEDNSNGKIALLPPNEAGGARFQINVPKA